MGPGPAGPPRAAILPFDPIFDELELVYDLGLDLNLMRTETPGSRYGWRVRGLNKECTECDGLILKNVGGFKVQENRRNGVS